MIAWPIAMLVWAVAGFYVWVPAVVVSGTIYIASLLAVALEWNDLMRAAEEAFQEIIRIYPDGFVNIHRALFVRIDNDDKNSEDSSLGKKWGDFIAFVIIGAICLAVATLFWWLVVGLLDEIF